MIPDNSARLLIVDDEYDSRHQIAKFIELELKNVEIHDASNGLHALDIIEKWQPHVILSDINMPGMNGIDLLFNVNKIFPNIQFVLFTGREDTEAPIQALKLGASDYLRKPLNMKELLLTIERALSRWTKNMELEQYRKHLEELVASRTRELEAANVNLRYEMEENIRLEAQLRQSQKLQAIGTLAGGIAHDFNNILSSIMGYSQLVMEHLEPGSALEKNMEQVIRGSIRARELVKQILTFSRKSEVTKIQVNPEIIAEEALQLIRASLPSTIELVRDFKSEGALILADPTQLHQVFINLCTNSAQAMEENKGAIEIAIKQVMADAYLRKQNPDLTKANYLQITVTDTGKGIPKDIIDKVFDPFFSTKPQGKGTGLGLSVVYGIVKDSGGAINIKSIEGKGTTFYIFFPVTNESVKDKRNSNPDDKEKKISIMFIDDEEDIAFLEKETLERMGYNVTAFTCSIKAFEAFRENPENFDLVITDYTMPDMTGDELSEELIKIRPDIPIILCTGSDNPKTLEHPDKTGICIYINKPFDKETLGNTIKKLLKP